jgi:hypothetical protein
MLELRLNKQHNRDYNITSARLDQRQDRVQWPINVGAADYREGTDPELAASGNVAVTTTDERLFLRGA